MSAKQHCDVCDAVIPDGDSPHRVDTIVRVEGRNNLVYDVRVVSAFESRYDSNASDLCIDCKRNVFRALAIKYGVKVTV